MLCLNYDDTIAPIAFFPQAALPAPEIRNLIVAQIGSIEPFVNQP
jgi:hypothetical protein